jgi:hypothetical protein
MRFHRQPTTGTRLTRTHRSDLLRSCQRFTVTTTPTQSEGSATNKAKAAQAFALDGYRIAVEEFKPADGAERDRSDEHYCQQHQPVSRPADPAIETEQKFWRTRVLIRPNPFGRRNNASSALRTHDGTGEHRPMRKRFRSVKASTSGIAADRSRERAQEFTGRRGVTSHASYSGRRDWRQ